MRAQRLGVGADGDRRHDHRQQGGRQRARAGTPDHEPLALQLSTLTAWIVAPGATPTTSVVLSRAAMVPETCVPWPLQSLFGPPAKLMKLATDRSVCAASLPVSMTYAWTPETAPEPLPASVEGELVGRAGDGQDTTRAVEINCSRDMRPPV